VPLLRPSARLRHRRPGIAAAVLLVVTSACQPTPARQVLVSATDYAFVAPASMPAGSTEIRLTNQGRVPHEMALGRLRAGMTVDSFQARIAAGGDPAELADGVVGILIVEPGDTSIAALHTALTSGRTYVLICQFRDADSLPPHIAMGMQASFTVD
jgi:hypothetical protein